MRPRRLSPAESEVCLLMAIGLTNREIAIARGTTFATAKYQAAQVLLRTGCNRHRLAEILDTVEVRDERRRTA
jgi:DNA-binding CsgD family transcriptional regulator